MSIQSEIDRVTGNVADAYAAVEEKGGALPEEQTSDNLAEAVKSINASAASSGEIYSTEETRIGTWIDGKPLYRKTYSITTDSSGESRVAFDTGLNIVNIYGTIKYSGDGRIYQLPAFIPGYIDAYCTVNDNGYGTELVATYTDNFRWGMPLVCTIEYTKTTDETETEEV